MALKKEIELENGIVLNYHRITSLNKVTNICNTIEVNSYINDKQREKEKIYQQLQKKSASGEELTEEEQEELNKGINVLVESDYINLDYNADMTIESAYEYLKTLEKYKDAEDVLTI